MSFTPISTGNHPHLQSTCPPLLIHAFINTTLSVTFLFAVTEYHIHDLRGGKLVWTHRGISALHSGEGRAVQPLFMAMGACGSREHELEPQMAITSEGPHLLACFCQAGLTSCIPHSPHNHITAWGQARNAWSYGKYFRFKPEETMGYSSKYSGPLGLHLI